MKRLLVALVLLALPIGLLSMPDDGLLWRLEQRWQAFVFAGDNAGVQARERIDTALISEGATGRALLDAWRSAAAASLDEPWRVALPHAETRTASGASLESATTFVTELDPDRVLHLATVAADGSVGGLLVDVFDGPVGAPAIASFGPAPFTERLAFDAWTRASTPTRADVPPAAMRKRRHGSSIPTPICWSGGHPTPPGLHGSRQATSCSTAARSATLHASEPPTGRSGGWWNRKDRRWSDTGQVRRSSRTAAQQHLQCLRDRLPTTERTLSGLRFETRLSLT